MKISTTFFAKFSMFAVGSAEINSRIWVMGNGKLTKTVKNPNYRGISTPFWNSLKGVGDLNTFGIYGTPNCGKGEPNQVIRVGHASPACLFSNVQVFGGV